jgi:serine/threonine-protein phosphatase 6 regulatory ankyrin repeat subunit B
MSTSDADGKPQVAMLEELVRFVLFAEDRESAKQAAAFFSTELLSIQSQIPSGKIQYQWRIEDITSHNAKERLEKVQENGPCYLHLVIPRSLVSVNGKNDVVKVEMTGRHWLLVLRMLAETERDEADDDGDTIFHHAARARLWKVMVMADIQSLNVMNRRNESPINLIQTAVQQQSRGFWKTASPDENKLLNAFNEFTKHRADTKSDLILHWAAKKGDFDTVCLLIKHGANVNAKNGDGATALHKACAYDRHYYSRPVETVRELLQNGVDLNERDNSGNTALHVTADKGKYDTVRELVKHGIDVNVKNGNGATALHKACTCSNFFAYKTAAALLKNGGDVNLKDNSGNTALYMGAKKGNSDTVRLLLQHGADVNVKNCDGKTPACLARERDDFHNGVLVLFELGAEVSQEDKDTALHVAADKGAYYNVRELIQHGANVNAQNGDCATPLHKACTCSTL